MLSDIQLHADAGVPPDVIEVAVLDEVVGGEQERVGMGGDDGAVVARADEGAVLRARYDPSLPPFSAMGYREAFGVLDGEMTVEQAIQLAARRTRQFARRQRAWFRSEPGITWLDATADPLPAALALADQITQGGG